MTITPEKADTWFLEHLSYDPSETALIVTVVEGKRASVPNDVVIEGKIFENVFAVAPAHDSRRVTLRFESVVAWQCVDESYTASNEKERFATTGLPSVLSQSPYLDYVASTHGWYKDVAGPAEHFRVWTENEVIDVVAIEPPKITVEQTPKTASDHPAAN